jgi:hypothetical protein
MRLTTSGNPGGCNMTNRRRLDLSEKFIGPTKQGVFYLPPLILLLATAPVWRGHRLQLLAFLAGIVGIWNFTVAIYPNARPSANEVLTFALEHQKDWPDGTRILYANSHPDLWLIQYFNLQARWMEMRAPDRS